MNTPHDVLIWTVAGLAVGAVLVPATRHLANQARGSGLLLPVASTLTASLFGLLAWRTPDLADLLAYSAFAALAVPLATIDIGEQRLPLPLLHSTYAAVMTLSATSSIVDGDLSGTLRASTGMATAFAVFLAWGMASPDDLGAGDVRLAGAIGWTLAWHSWTALTVATAVFAITTLAALLAAHARRRTQIPAGPTMLLGALAALMT